MTKVIKCTCKHEFQDMQYGKNQRVCNSLAKNNGKINGYRCTVCGDKKPA
jgi:hypothetical protein